MMIYFYIEGGSRHAGKSETKNTGIDSGKCPSV
jgi:hypothetical protein